MSKATQAIKTPDAAPKPKPAPKPGKGNRTARHSALSKEEKQQLLNDALALQKDPNFQSVLLGNLGIIAKHHGVTALTKATGLCRETHYLALKPKGNPSTINLLLILKGLGIKVDIVIRGAPHKYQQSISKAMGNYNFGMLKLALRKYCDEAYGLNVVSHQAEMCRTSIYRIVGDNGNPNTTNLIKIINAIEGDLTLEALD